MPSNLLRQPNFAALLILVWLVVALALLLQYWPQTAETLLDTDDAMRLVQMREWLARPDLLGGWFDMHQARMQPPLAVDMHWSRLIDAGLACLLVFFQLFTDQLDAERLQHAFGLNVVGGDDIHRQRNSHAIHCSVQSQGAMREMLPARAIDTGYTSTPQPGGPPGIARQRTHCVIMQEDVTA